MALSSPPRMNPLSFCRIPVKPLPFSRVRLIPLLTHCHISSTSNSPTTPLTTKDKIQTTLSLLKSNNSSAQILHLCRAANEFLLHGMVLSNTISKLIDSEASFDPIQSFFEELKTSPSMLCSFLEELKASPDLRSEGLLCNSISLYGHAQMFDRAIRTFEDMGVLGIAQTTESLNSLLRAGLYARKYSEVSKIFDEFPKNYGITPDLETYNLVIKALCESRSPSSVYSILDEMDREGCKPDDITVSTILARFNKEGKDEDVWKVLKRMEKHGTQLVIHIYNGWIHNLCRLWKTAEAKALFEGISSRGVKPNGNTYGHLILWFAEEGNGEEVRRLFNDMRENGVERYDISYMTVVECLCEAGDFETALWVCNDSMANSYSYKTLATYLIRCGKLETALQLCKDAMSKGFKLRFGTMCKLLDGLVSIGGVEEARKLLREFEESFPERADSWKLHTHIQGL